MRELTIDEMNQVAGGFGPIGGGLLGAGAYVGMSLMAGRAMDFPSLTGAVAFGAVTSGFGILGGTLQGVAATVRTVHATSLGSLAGAATQSVTRGISGGGSSRTGGSRIRTKSR